LGKSKIGQASCFIPPTCIPADLGLTYDNNFIVAGLFPFPYKFSTVSVRTTPPLEMGSCRRKPLQVKVVERTVLQD